MEVNKSSWRVGMVLILCKQCRWFLGGCRKRQSHFFHFFCQFSSTQFQCRRSCVFCPLRISNMVFEVVIKNNYLSSKRVIVLETLPFPDPLLWWWRCTWNGIAGPPPLCCAISIFFQGVSCTRSDFPEESGCFLFFGFFCLWASWLQRVKPFIPPWVSAVTAVPSIPPELNIAAAGRHVGWCKAYYMLRSIDFLLHRGQHLNIHKKLYSLTFSVPFWLSQHLAVVS